MLEHVADTVEQHSFASQFWCLVIRIRKFFWKLGEIATHFCYLQYRSPLRHGLNHLVDVNAQWYCGWSTICLVVSMFCLAASLLMSCYSKLQCNRAFSISSGVCLMLCAMIAFL